MLDIVECMSGFEEKRLLFEKNKTQRSGKLSTLFTKPLSSNVQVEDTGIYRYMKGHYK